MHVPSLTGAGSRRTPVYQEAAAMDAAQRRHLPRPCSAGPTRHHLRKGALVGMSRSCSSATTVDRALSNPKDRWKTCLQTIREQPSFESNGRPEREWEAYKNISLPPWGIFEPEASRFVSEKTPVKIPQQSIDSRLVGLPRRTSTTTAANYSAPDTSPLEQLTTFGINQSAVPGRGIKRTVSSLSRKALNRTSAILAPIRTLVSAVKDHHHKQSNSGDGSNIKTPQNQNKMSIGHAYRLFRFWLLLKIKLLKVQWQNRRDDVENSDGWD
jgi:hypothetical protein